MVFVFNTIHITKVANSIRPFYINKSPLLNHVRGSLVLQYVCAKTTIVHWLKLPLNRSQVHNSYNGEPAVLSPLCGADWQPHGIVQITHCRWPYGYT